MSLRLRLLLGYAYLVALLLATAGSAVLGFVSLSRIIEPAVGPGFARTAAATRLLETLERQDSATLAALLDPATASAEEMRKLEQEFEATLETVREGVRDEDAAPTLTLLAESYQTYRAARQELLVERPERPLARYHTTVYPSFFATKGQILALLELHHQATRAADREVRQAALRSAAWQGFLVTVALVSLVLLSRGLQRNILERLTILRSVSEAIASGAAERRLPESGQDELAVLARMVNASLDRQAETTARTESRVCHERELVLALAHHLGPSILVLGLDGSVIVDQSDASHRALLEPLREWVHTTGQEERKRCRGGGAAAPCAVPLPTGAATAELLFTGPRRPVAWLVRLPAAEG